MNKNLTNRAIAKEVAIDLESSDALNYYLAQLRETPLLSKEQEEELFFRLQNADDMDALKNLLCPISDLSYILQKPIKDMVCHYWILFRREMLV